MPLLEHRVRTSFLAGVAALSLFSQQALPQSFPKQTTEQKTDSQEVMRKAFSYTSLIMSSPTTRVVSYTMVDNDNNAIGEQKEYHANGGPCPDVIIRYPVNMDVLMPITQEGNVEVLMPVRFAREFFVKYPVHLMHQVTSAGNAPTPYISFQLSRQKDGKPNTNADGTIRYTQKTHSLEDNPLFDHKHCRPSII